MAKVLSNFLVGIGFDLDKKSADGVASGIDNIKSKALQLGTVVAGAFGIKALTNDFAAAKDDLGKFAEVFGSTADEINAFGNALRLEGGTLEGFMSQLASLEKFRAGLATGDTGFLEAAGRAGIDTRALINATTATEGFLALADQFQKMTRKQRISAAQALGLDEASIRLLSRGRDAIEEIVAIQRKMRPVTDDMTAAAAEFNDEMQDLGTNVGGVADQISVRLLPQINNVLKGMNAWIMANSELISGGLDSFFDSLGEKAAVIAASLGLVTAGVTAAAGGAVLAKGGALAGSSKVASVGKGVGAGGKFASKAGVVGLVGVAGFAVGTAINEFLLSQEAKDSIGKGIAQGLAFFGSDEAQASLDRDAAFNTRLVSAVNKESMNVDRESSESVLARIPGEGRSQPIHIRNQVVIDGRIIDDRVNKTVGEMADQAIVDLQSSEGG